MTRRRRLRRDQPKVSYGLVILGTLAFLVLALVLVSGATAAGSAYAFYTSKAQAVADMANNQLFQTTRIYDRNGRLLYQLYGEGRRTFVSYDHISPWVIKATVDVEDKTFWTNSGIDPTGIIRAAFNDTSGGDLQGASTITQQLVRNTPNVLNDDSKTLQRKLEEAILAIETTNQYPKYKILEMYLNTVYYGDSDYGIEAAAEDYYNMRPEYSAKYHRIVWPAEELDLAHASLLAGLPRSPSDYAPNVNPQAALARQQEVLKAMENVGDITPQQAAAATAETQRFIKSIRGYQGLDLAPHFVQYVINQVLEPSLGAQVLNSGGLNIYTTLDLTLEQKVEQIVHDVLTYGYYDQFGNHFPPGPGGLASYYNANNGAAVVIEPRTGEILAMDGSENYNANTPQVQGQFNIVDHATRQAGSAFKPIVYATAFQMGWFPSLVMQNTYPICFPATVGKPGACGNWYAPSNFDGSVTPPLPLRQALDNSYNLPAVQAIEFTGIQNVLINARRMGITSLGLDASQYGPSLVLGTSPVSLLQLTNAYTVFDNLGRFIPAVSILQIDDAFGHVLYKYQPPQGAQVLSPQIAYLMTNVLSDDQARYREFYYHSALSLPSDTYNPSTDNYNYNPSSYRPAAAKTGTTDDNKDILQVGYTPYLACGVWVGNSDDEPMAHNIIGIAGAGPIWQQIMEYADQHYNLPPSPFPMPPGLVQGRVSATTGLAPYAGQSASYTDWFIQGNLPDLP